MKIVKYMHYPEEFRQYFDFSELSGVSYYEIDDSKADEVLLFKCPARLLNFLALYGTEITKSQLPSDIKESEFIINEETRDRIIEYSNISVAGNIPINYGLAATNQDFIKKTDMYMDEYGNWNRGAEKN